MVLLLRTLVSNQRLFSKNLVSFKPAFSNRAYNSENKKSLSTSRRNYSSEYDDNEEKVLIYTGILGNRIRRLKMVSLTTSCLSLVGQPFFFTKVLEEDTMTSIATLFVAINFVTLATPLVIYRFSRRYVLKCFYCPKDKNYIINIYNNIFSKKKEIVFTPSDVQKPKLDGPFTTCIIHGHPLMMDGDAFTDRRHYNIIMGYNVPKDFEEEKLEIRPINRAPLIEKSHQIESKSICKE